MILPRLAAYVLFASSIAGCSLAGVKPSTTHHVTQNSLQSAPSATDIPQPLTRSLTLPPPRAQAKPETYSVVVNNVKVQELLFALARDARVNVDIHPGVTGNVTLNVLDQTLPQLLTRIARQIDMRFELDGPNLVVMPDTPYLRNYKIDYVNLARDTSISLGVSTRLTTNTTLPGGASGASSATGNNGSTTTIASSAKNRLWESLIQNLKDLLRETDKQVVTGQRSCNRSEIRTGESRTGLAGSQNGDAIDKNGNSGGAGSSSDNCISVEYLPAGSIMANAETGIIAVRATSRQHEKVREFVDQISTNAKRQVLIEATIAEVELSQNYQQGINWSALNIFDTGLRIIQKPQGTLTAPGASLIEIGLNSSGGNFTSSLKFLESFGNVRVLSSPKLTVLNNQSAVMKVVDDVVYFTVKAETIPGTTTNPQGLKAVTSTPNTIPVGLVMSVTPQIGDDDTITLNVRPSLSRVVGEAVDPNPDIVIRSAIPIIRSRELDSVMRVTNGNIAVMGGLMEDLLDLKTDAVPAASNLPLLGFLFQNRNDTKKKTELVIFIRPTIIRDPSMAGDFANQRDTLPDGSFFDKRIGPPLVPPLPNATGDTQP